MPCNCDHLEPNEFERESKLVCKFLVYSSDVLGGFKLPRWVKQASEASYGDSQRCSEATEMLCTLLTNLSSKQRDLIVYNARNATSRRLADWWEKHQAADREREAEESRQKQLKNARVKALAKLSPEEKKLLNLL